MDNIDISFGDDILIGQEPGINIDEQNNVEAVSDIVGIPGEKGEPGFSPIANVTQTANGAIITITDEQGTTTATVTNGQPGVSPSASVTETASGAVIEITDANGTTTATINDGEDGNDGANATISIGSVTSLSYGSTPTVTNSGTATNAILNWGIPEGQRGEQGIQGIPGINAQAYVTQNTGSATITIEDVDGTTTATVYDGQNGQDGFSPSASVTQNTGSATISITDQNGTTTATVYDGQNGSNGTNATATVGTTTTLPAGSSATVTNSSSDPSNAVFDFGIPRGADGTNGQDGRGFVNFSTAEQDTGLTWTNGSKIYQMSFMDNMPSITQGTYGLKAFTLPATPSKVIKIEGGVRRTTGTLMWYPLNTPVIQNGTVNGYVETHMFGADIYVMSNNANVSGAEITLTIYYIK